MSSIEIGKQVIVLTYRHPIRILDIPDVLGINVRHYMD